MPDFPLAQSQLPPRHTMYVTAVENLAHLTPSISISLSHTHTHGGLVQAIVLGLAACVLLCLAGGKWALAGRSRAVSLLDASDAGMDDGGSVLGALESSIDKSIDDKVTAYLSVPEMSSMPIPCDQTRGCARGANWWHGGAIQRGEKSYLERLIGKKEALEERKEKVLSSLRHQRNMAAEIAAKGMLSMERKQLHSALMGAKQRVSEESQKWGNVLAAKEDAAYLAKEHAISVIHGAMQHNAEMDALLK